MPWEVTVAGTVTLDDVTTPQGRSHPQQGGSAVYSALAAARTGATVHLCGAVGADGVESLRAALAGTAVDTASLAVLEGSTFRWTAEHDFTRWVTRHEHADEGVATRWRPRLGDAAAGAPVLFLGSMRPWQQLEVLHQSGARLVGADSMTVHIGRERDAVMRVVTGCDVLFLNRAELEALTGDQEWERAARSLLGGRLRAMVVKAGPEGAALVTRAAVTEMEARPVAPVVDPTGAGDSLAGGMLAACALAARDDDDFLPQALAAGLSRAAECVGSFGVAGLRAAARS